MHAEETKKVYLEIEGGKRFATVSEEVIAETLAQLHLEYNARATLHGDEGSWLSVYGSPSTRFALSYHAANTKDVLYCSKMLSTDEAKGVLVSFLLGQSNWQERLGWKKARPHLNLFLKGVIILITVSIVITFVIELFGWW